MPDPDTDMPELELHTATVTECVGPEDPDEESPESDAPGDPDAPEDVPAVEED